MHGHKNGLKTLLKLGPILWSGSDDGTIRLAALVGSEFFVFFVWGNGDGSGYEYGVWGINRDGSELNWVIGGMRY